MIMSKLPHRLFAVLVVTVGLVTAPHAWAQTRSAIVGTITDASGAVLPGVSVTVTSPNLVGGPQTVVTSALGTYRFIELLPGVYDVEVALGGFQTMRQTELRVPFGMTLTVDFSLSVAKVAMAVTVSASALVVDVTSPQSTTTLDGKLLQELPNSNRRLAYEVINFAPGINSNAALGGARDGNNLMIDGMPTTMPQRNGTASAHTSVNWLEEVQIVSLGASAEYGEFNGVVANMVVRSGSNRFQGLVDVRPSPRRGWFSDNTRDLPADLRARFKRTGNSAADSFDATAQIGGPIKKNRVFFFAGYQYYREKTNTGGPIPRDEHWPRGIGKVNWAASNALRFEGFLERDYATVDGLGSTANTSIEATAVQHSPKTLWNGRMLFTKSAATQLEVHYGGLQWQQRNDPREPGTRSGPVPRRDTLLGISFGNVATYRLQHGERNLVEASLTHLVEGFLGRRHQLKFGAEFERTRFNQESGYPGGRLYVDVGGVPDQVKLWDGDNTHAIGKRLTVYAQDGWTLGRGVTLQPGIRASLYRGSVPEGSRLKTNAVDPRFGVAWDLFANHKTVLRGNVGRFHDALFTATFDFMNTAGLNPKITARVLGPNSFNELNRTSIPTNFALDANLKYSCMNQYLVALERELFPAFSLTLQYVRRDFVNIMAFRDTASQYATVSGLDPGPDGVAGTADDGPVVTVYNLLNPGQGFLLLTNPADAHRRYDGFQIIGRKRYSRNWQLQASYTYSITRGNINNNQSENSAGGPNTGMTGIYVNPNRLINNDGSGSFEFPHEVKILGTYRVPLLGGFTGSGNYIYRSGTPYGRTAIFRGLRQGNENILVEPRGTRRTDNISQIDVRFEQSFRLRSTWTVGIYADIYNLTNAGAAAAYVPASGATFGQIASWTYPRMLEVGIRAAF